MTRFERDRRAIEEDVLEATEILKRRKAEIERLEHDFTWCKNSFRRECIDQELTARKNEYNKLDAMI